LSESLEDLFPSDPTEAPTTTITPIEATRARAVVVFKDLLLMAKAQLPTSFAEIFGKYSNEVFLKFRRHGSCMLQWSSGACLAHNVLAELHNEQARASKPNLNDQDDEYWPIMPKVFTGRSFEKQYITQIFSHGRTCTPVDWGIGLWNMVDSEHPPWWSRYIPAGAKERKLFRHQYCVLYNDFFYTNLPNGIQVVDILACKL
jgi:hypothetical protein